MTQIEKGQMSIFDVLENEEVEIFIAPARTTDKTESVKDAVGTVRINEYHLDERYCSKEFKRFMEATGKGLGDLFTIQEFRIFQKNHKRGGQ